VTTGSTDDDEALDAPTDRVLVDIERRVDTVSSLRLQFNTDATYTQKPTNSHIKCKKDSQPRRVLNQNYV